MSKPIRCFEGVTQPFERFWRVVDAEETESGEAEIEFYGYISEYSWYEDDLTPAKFREDLAKLGNKPVTVRIHSGGGDVFAASAIRAMIMDYPGKVTTRIDGLCASAATYVAMAGDIVKMQDSGFFMIHDPWTVAIGSEDELKKVVELLKSVKQGIVETYQGKTKLAADKLARMMSAETWMTAQEALGYGFVDEVIVANPLKASKIGNMAVLNALQNFAKVPPAILQAIQTMNVAPVEAASEPLATSEPLLTEDMQREAQTLRAQVDLILRKELEDA
jgi:ATP-dependent Clp protease protease subunit